jgi:hypothetical protein
VDGSHTLESSTYRGSTANTVDTRHSERFEKWSEAVADYNGISPVVPVPPPQTS